MLKFADLAIMRYVSRGSEPPAEVQKAIGEGRTGAIFALGLADAIGIKTWMRLVHPREGAPDVRVMYLEPTGPRGSNRMEILQVEVATYTRHSTESLGEFAFAKKLAPGKKAYTGSTAVVIHVQRGCRPQDIEAAHNYLVKRGAHGHCCLLGMLADSRWQVTQVFPHQRGPRTIDLQDALTSDQAPVVQTKRGMSAVAVTDPKPTPTPNPFLDFDKATSLSRPG